MNTKYRKKEFSASKIKQLCRSDSHRVQRISLFFNIRFPVYTHTHTHTGACSQRRRCTCFHIPFEPDACLSSSVKYLHSAVRWRSIRYSLSLLRDLCSSERTQPRSRDTIWRLNASSLREFKYLYERYHRCVHSFLWEGTGWAVVFSRGDSVYTGYWLRSWIASFFFFLNYHSLSIIKIGKLE